METSQPWAATIHTALDEALALVLPVTCAGCGEVDVSLCEGCRRLLRPIARMRRVEDVPVWSGLVYEGVPARVIRSLKEDARTGLARPLAPALSRAVEACGATGAVLVPVPTSRASFRRRGFRVTELVAHRAGLPVARLLRTTRQPADQRGLELGERRSNVAGAFAARRAGGLRVVVVDDVVTTGATIAEAVRALREAGALVVGAASIASTPRRGHRPTET